MKRNPVKAQAKPKRSVKRASATAMKFAGFGKALKSHASKSPRSTKGY